MSVDVVSELRVAQTDEADSSAAARVEAYLLSLIRPETRSYAARAGIAQRNVRALMAALDSPHRALRVIHVTGSKGKGTTALLLESLLQEAGLRTATFTSPHLERWTERFRVDATEVDAEVLAEVLARLAPHVAALAAADADDAPSFFEVITAAALLLFAESNVDVAILEVGLGGRFDATNVITPLASIITSVEMEHCDKLGLSLIDIARHKAGIIKPGVPVICGRLPPVARMEVHAEAERLGAPVYALGRDFLVDTQVDGDGRRTLDMVFGDSHLHTSTALRAAHLACCAALAIAAARCAGLLDAEQVSRYAPRALSRASLPGRVEILGSQPWLLVDGAHTSESARELATAIGALPARERVLLLSVSGVKNAATVLQPLLRGATRVVVTRAESLRSQDPEAVAAQIRTAFPTLPVSCIEDPVEAFAQTRATTPADSLLCATGSMYLAGLVRRLERETRGKRAVA